MGIDSRVLRIVFVRMHLVVRAYYYVLLLVGSFSDKSGTVGLDICYHRSTARIYSLSHLLASDWYDYDSLCSSETCTLLVGFSMFSDY